MDDPSSRLFFLQPASTFQRQYEALRAVFVDHGRQKDVAQRFGYSYAAFRQLVRHFRSGCAVGQPPPFSPCRATAGCRPALRPPRRPNRQPRPTAEP